MLGGSINTCSRFGTAGGPIFVKHGDAELLVALQGEAAGLGELATAQAVRVPRALAAGERFGIAFLVLEWIDLSSATARSETRLGELLALQHRVTHCDFGWRRDNTIGSIVFKHIALALVLFGGGAVAEQTVSPLTAGDQQRLKEQRELKPTR